MQNSDEHLYANHEHIIRTSQQWNETYLYNKPIPRGVLCIELTPKNHTRLKVGEGDKFYRQLPYIDGDAELSNYYTKQEIDQMFRNLEYLSIASDTIYESRNDLPKSGNKKGDIRYVKNPDYKAEDPLEYMWNGKKWILLGGGIMDIDLSAYAKKSEVNPRLDRLEQQAHTHANKAVLDRTTASYTLEEKSKLAGLHNYDDTVMNRRVTTLESKAHTHANKDILDATTASFTREEKTKLAELENYSDFVGTDGTGDGTHGLVPAPQSTDANKYLSSDGTWKSVAAGSIEPATADTLGGVKIGSGVNVTQDGTISVTPYDDTAVRQDITALQASAHTHSNKSVLDNTTASYTIEEQTKLAGLENYTLPIASADTLGGIKVGENLSIDQNGVLSATGGGGGSGGVGNLVDGVATTVSTADVDTDMFTDVQWEQGSITENGNVDSNARIRTHDYYPITIPNDGKITLITHDTNDVGLTWNIMLYTTDQQLLLDSPWMPYGSELNLIEYINTGKLARYVIRYSNSDPISPSDLKDAILRMTNTAIDVNYNSGLTVNQDNELEVLPATNQTIGGVIIGDGIYVDENGVISVTGGGGEGYSETELISAPIVGSVSSITLLDSMQNYDALTFEFGINADNFDQQFVRIVPVSDLNDTTNMIILDGLVYAAGSNWGVGYSIYKTSDTTLHVTYQGTSSWSQSGTIFSIKGIKYGDGGGGGSKEYLAGEGISITERSEERDVPVDISSEHWVNESPTGGGSRYTISTNQTYLLQRYSLEAGTSFKVKFVPTNPNDIIYYGFDSYPSNSDNSGGVVVIGQTGPVDGFEVDQSKTYTMPADRNSLDIYIRINDTHWTSSDVVSAASFSELKLIVTKNVSMGAYIDANVRDGLTIDSSDNTINVTPATTTDIGGVIVGNGLNITQQGVLSLNQLELHCTQNPSS